jgi:CHAD domain-containing protein
MSAPQLCYVLNPDKEVGSEVLRILGEISSRGQFLAKGGHNATEEFIHEARLLIKRLRALLWFEQPALGSILYNRTRTRLRQAAALLAGERDLTVTRKTLDKIAQKASSEHDEKTVEEIVNPQGANSPVAVEGASTTRRILREAMGILRQSVAEVGRRTRKNDAWPKASARLAAAVRAMKKSSKRAQRTGKDVDFHTWRKKAKQLLYVLELTQVAPKYQLGRRIQCVAKLESTLGDYHDFVMAGERIQQTGEPSHSVSHLLKLTQKLKQHFRRKTRKLANKIDLSLKSGRD